MTEKPQPIVVAEEATTSKATSAEDRKAASALASMDSAAANDSNNKPASTVDQDAMKKAVKGLSKTGAARTAAKSVKVDQADVVLLVDQLELTKPKATELLKQHEGSAVKAMAAFISA